MDITSKGACRVCKLVVEHLLFLPCIEYECRVCETCFRIEIEKDECANCGNEFNEQVKAVATGTVLPLRDNRHGNELYSMRVKFNRFREMVAMSHKGILNICQDEHREIDARTSEVLNYFTQIYKDAYYPKQVLAKLDDLDKKMKVIGNSIQECALTHPVHIFQLPMMNLYVQINSPFPDMDEEKSYAEVHLMKTVQYLNSLQSGRDLFKFLTTKPKRMQIHAPMQHNSVLHTVQCIGEGRFLMLSGLGRLSLIEPSRLCPNLLFDKANFTEMLRATPYSVYINSTMSPEIYRYNAMFDKRVLIDKKSRLLASNREGFLLTEKDGILQIWSPDLVQILSDQVRLFVRKSDKCSISSITNHQTQGNESNKWSFVLSILRTKEGSLNVFLLQPERKLGQVNGLDVVCENTFKVNCSKESILHVAELGTMIFVISDTIIDHWMQCFHIEVENNDLKISPRFIMTKPSEIPDSSKLQSFSEGCAGRFCLCFNDCSFSW